MTRRWRDDTGASLVLALIFITVVAVVVAVVLSLADTNLRATVALRGQAIAAADADGAAQIAINELRKGSTTCFTGGTTLTVAPLDAAVTCEQDTGNSGGSLGPPINSSNKPGSAILTLGTSTAEDGINIKVNGGRTVKVRGGIFSNSNIDIELGTLEVENAGVTARRPCTGTITSTPAAVCNIGAVADPRGNDPNYPAPTAAATPRTVPNCRGDGNVVTFLPGLYEGNADVNALNALTRSSGCKDAIFHFTPGTYYFNFPASRPWSIETGYVIGGTAAPGVAIADGATPAIPGACWAPIPPRGATSWTPPPADAGVQFVFGGGSQIRVGAAKFEICGTYSATSPPIAAYGLKSAAMGVPAQSGCTVVVNGCPTIYSDNSPESRVYVQGTTYIPGGSLQISLNNKTGQVFRYGVIARSLDLNPTGSADLSEAVIEVPDDTPGGGKRTILYLNVYVCPDGTGTCTPGTGRLRLRAKVGIIDPTGAVVAGAREVTVYSWSVLR